VVTAALQTTRASLVGPFAGATQQPALGRIDDPARLTRWEALPRLQACELEFLSGLVFRPDARTHALGIGFVDLNHKPLTEVPIAWLQRPGEGIFREQLDLVVNYADLRGAREAEILAQALPSQQPFWAGIVGLQPHRHRHTLELITLALMLAVDVHMRCKHVFACPRPVAWSPQIQPLIPTPGHSSWPSGHATEIHTVIAVLDALLPHAQAVREPLQRVAARIAVNRTVAGLHFPVDSAAGRVLGEALGAFFVARCAGQPRWRERRFAGPAFRADDGSPLDFDPRAPIEQARATQRLRASPLLAHLWALACNEWADAGA